MFMQGVLLLIVGPAIDKMVSGSWLYNYKTMPGAMPCLMASCLIAVMVNVSQFMCLGRFSALTFQVRGRCFLFYQSEAINV